MIEISTSLDIPSRKREIVGKVGECWVAEGDSILGPWTILAPDDPNLWDELEKINKQAAHLKKKLKKIAEKYNGVSSLS